MMPIIGYNLNFKIAKNTAIHIITLFVSTNAAFSMENTAESINIITAVYIP